MCVDKCVCLLVYVVCVNDVCVLMCVDECVYFVCVCVHVLMSMCVC